MVGTEVIIGARVKGTVNRGLPPRFIPANHALTLFDPTLASMLALTLTLNHNPNLTLALTSPFAPTLTLPS